MNLIVETLVTWLQWECGNARNLNRLNVPYYAVLPKSWEELIPDLAQTLKVKWEFIMLVMSQLYWREGKKLSPIEVYMIITDTIENFRRM